jgi:hypothetical protein
VASRIAVGPQQGRKVFPLQTPPARDEPFDDPAGKAAGISLHACVAAKARERKKLEPLCRCISRPPVPEKRLSLTPNAIRYQIETAYGESLPRERSECFGHGALRSSSSRSGAVKNGGSRTRSHRMKGDTCSSMGEAVHGLRLLLLLAAVDSAYRLPGESPASSIADCIFAGDI